MTEAKRELLNWMEAEAFNMNELKVSASDIADKAAEIFSQPAQGQGDRE